MKSRSIALYVVASLLCGSVTSVKTGTPELVLGVPLLASLLLTHEAAKQPAKNIRVHRDYGVLFKQQQEEVIQVLQKNKSFLEQLKRNENVRSDKILVSSITQQLDCVYKELDEADKALNKTNQALEKANEKLASAHDFLRVVDITLLCSLVAGAVVYCVESSKSH